MNHQTQFAGITKEFPTEIIFHLLQYTNTTQQIETNEGNIMKTNKQNKNIKFGDDIQK